MFAYGKLQAVSCDPKAEPDLQEVHTASTALVCAGFERLNPQQQEPRWQQESEKLIESHVRFMASHPRTMIKAAVLNANSIDQLFDQTSNQSLIKVRSGRKHDLTLIILLGLNFVSY